MGDRMTETGLSLRDLLAVHLVAKFIVLNGPLASVEFNVGCTYGYADAMLKARLPTAAKKEQVPNA